MTRYTKKLMLMVLLFLIVPLGGIGYMTVKAGARLTEEVYANVRLANVMARAQVVQYLELQRALLQPLVRRVEAGGLRGIDTSLASESGPLPVSRESGRARGLPWRGFYLVVQDDPSRAHVRLLSPSRSDLRIDATLTPWGKAFARAPHDPPLALAGEGRKLFLISPLDLEGRPAALVAEGSLDDLASRLSRLELPASTQCFLLDRSGDILVSLPAPQASASPIDLLGYEAQSGSPDVGTYTNAAQQSVVGTHTKIPGTPWELLSEVDEAQALGGARMIVVKNRWLNACVVLVVAFMALFASRSVTGPVAALSETVRRISEGDLAARVTIRTGDELENLGDGFNQMVSRLQDLYEDMDARVKERTRELDEANSHLQDANRRLEEASRVKSQFLATMSHELRTPLNAIIGFSELMADEIPGPLTEDQKQCVDDVLDSGRHLLGLINNILDLSKIEAGRMEVVRRPFELQTLMEGLVRNLQPLADQKRHVLELEVPDGLPLLEADEGKVRQVLTNLVGNAVKFTPEGGRISLSAARDGGGFRIEVADTGVGISEEDQKLIFEEFRQVDGSYTREQEGTGLGLALTRKLVELHGGGIGVRSRPGEGSTFWFTLPDPTHPGEASSQDPRVSET